MLHIVFDKDDAEALRKSFELDESLDSEILVINEDWSLGPLVVTINNEGETTNRSEWMARLFNIHPQEEDYLETIKKFLRENPDNHIWIWIAPNSRDVCGYYFLVSNLDAFKGQVFSIWLNNLPFINEKGQIFYPEYLKQIPAREFVKAKKLAQQISPAIFETDPDEWKKMQIENKMLRTLEGAKKISGRDESFFDKEILEQVQNEWQKNSKIFQQLSIKAKGAFNKTFLIWRLRELINTNILEARGDWPVADNFDVRKKQEIPQSSAANE